MNAAAPTSAAILERIAASYPPSPTQTLHPAYFDLLNKLGDPHKHLPPVLHVAGTNGKGSTCAFLRAVLEAAGYRVHVYTSPHLVTFHERIRLGGHLIAEDALTALLLEIERHAAPGAVSHFELATIAAFTAFARQPADYVVLETGLGGRLDATNIVERPLATAITRISFDHGHILGSTLADIAAEKAGIMKPGVPCCIGYQADNRLDRVFARIAAEQQTPLLRFGYDWRVDPAGSKSFRYIDRLGMLDLPLPALIGAHQVANAALALAVLRLGAQLELGRAPCVKGLQTVEWPARLQRLRQGPMVDLLPPGWELWLDGGHNDSAGEVLAQQAGQWRQQDGAAPKPLLVVYGMLNTKQPQEFLQPFAPVIAALRAVAIPDHPNSLPVGEAVAAAQAAGIPDAAPALDVRQAVQNLTQQQAKPARILICGSLYLAGHVLAAHG